MRLFGRRYLFCLVFYFFLCCYLGLVVCLFACLLVCFIDRWFAFGFVCLIS